MPNKRISIDVISKKILILREQKVMLDKDMAGFYAVKPIALRQQVKRNIERFPPDFMFQLDKHEISQLVSQFVIPSIQSLGGAQPYVFTEQGIAMLSSVLKSKKAVLVNIAIMRVFVKMREMMLMNKELAQQIEKLQNKVGRHDKEIQVIFECMKQLMSGPKKKGTGIGFHI